LQEVVLAAPEVVQLLNLSDFASFIEVSVGLNLLYSFWRDLRERTSKNFSNKVLEHKTTLRMKSKSFAGGRAEQSIDSIASAATTAMNITVRLAQYSSLIVSFFLICSLIFLGYEPLYKITYTQATILWCSALFISGLFISITFFISRRASKKLKNLISTQLTVLSDMTKDLESMEEQLDNVIPPNDTK